MHRRKNCVEKCQLESHAWHTRARTPQKGKKFTPMARSSWTGRFATLRHLECTGRPSNGSISTVLTDELSPLVPPTTNRAPIIKLRLVTFLAVNPLQLHFNAKRMLFMVIWTSDTSKWITLSNQTGTSGCVSDLQIFLMPWPELIFYSKGRKYIRVRTTGFGGGFGFGGFGFAAGLGHPWIPLRSKET